MKKRTIQIEFKSDDDDAVAAFINGVCLMASAAFGPDNQRVVFGAVGVKKLRASLSEVEWKSANVKGRMKMT